MSDSQNSRGKPAQQCSRETQPARMAHARIAHKELRGLDGVRLSQPKRRNLSYLTHEGIVTFVQGFQLPVRLPLPYFATLPTRNRVKPSRWKMAPAVGPLR